MNFLAIDASTEACSVAIKYNDKQFSEYELCPQSHSLRLLPMVDSVLKQANVKLSDLNGIIFGRGIIHTFHQRDTRSGASAGLRLEWMGADRNDEGDLGRDGEAVGAFPQRWKSGACVARG